MASSLRCRQRRCWDLPLRQASLDADQCQRKKKTKGTKISICGKDFHPVSRGRAKRQLEVNVETLTGTLSLQSDGLFYRKSCVRQLSTRDRFLVFCFVGVCQRQAGKETAWKCLALSQRIISNRRTRASTLRLAVRTWNIILPGKW